MAENIRIRRADKNLIQIGGKKNLNQRSQSRRVDPIVIGDQDPWSIAGADEPVHYRRSELSFKSVRDAFEI